MIALLYTNDVIYTNSGITILRVTEVLCCGKREDSFFYAPRTDGPT